jgi:hypothetical protein
MQIVCAEVARLQALTERIDQRTRDAQVRAQAHGYTLHVASDGFLLSRWAAHACYPTSTPSTAPWNRSGGQA